MAQRLFRVSSATVRGHEGQAQWGDLVLHQDLLVGMEERCLGVAQQGQHPLGAEQLLLLGLLLGEQPQGHEPDRDKEGWLLRWQAVQSATTSGALNPPLRYRTQRS